VRTVSQRFAAAARAPETGECPLLLLTLSHPSFAEPVRVCNNGVSITSRGHVFAGYPFQAVVGSESPDAPPQATLTIDNVDRSIVQAVRSVSGEPITVTVELALAATPDLIEAGPFEFAIRSAEYDALVVTGSLRYEDILNEPFPADEYDPTNFPGLHGLSA